MEDFYKFTDVNGSQFLINRSRIIDVCSHVDSEISTVSYVSHDVVLLIKVDMNIDEVFDYLKV